MSFLFLVRCMSADPRGNSLQQGFEAEKSLRELAGNDLDFSASKSCRYRCRFDDQILPAVEDSFPLNADDGMIRK